MARPRAADFDEHRDAILAMAARLFADRGYAAGSIAELASACGVSKALLYHYYRDKEQLLFDIADRYIDSLLLIVDEVAAESLPPQMHLRRLIERFMAAYEHAAAYHRVLVQDVKYLSAPHRRRVNAKQGRVVEAFAAAIAAVAPHLTQAALLKPVTMTLFGMINWTFTWLKEAGPLTYAQMAPVVADLFIAGVGAVGAVGVKARGAAARRALAAAANGPGTARVHGDGNGSGNGHAVATGRTRAGGTAARRPAAPPPPVPPHLPRAPRKRSASKTPREVR